MERQSPRSSSSRTRYYVDEAFSIKIDPRSDLEVSDSRHRYAKNLRRYFIEFGTNTVEGQNVVVNQGELGKWALFSAFFNWLDNNEFPPEIDECPRQSLDNDTVLYLLSDEDREEYVVDIDSNGCLLRRQNNCVRDSKQPSSSSAQLKQPSCSETNVSSGYSWIPLNTGADGWIFVIRSGVLFAGEKRTKTFPRFHHSSFFAGADVEGAGMLVAEDGRLKRLFPHSGHYRPQDRHLQYMLEFFERSRVDMKSFDVDAQRVVKIDREKDGAGNKKKKVDAAHFMNARDLMDLLRSKNRAVQSGLLAQIERDRTRQQQLLSTSPAAGVAAGGGPPSEALLALFGNKGHKGLPTGECSSNQVEDLKPAAIVPNQHEFGRSSRRSGRSRAGTPSATVDDLTDDAMVRATMKRSLSGADVRPPSGSLDESVLATPLAAVSLATVAPAAAGAAASAATQSASLSFNDCESGAAAAAAVHSAPSSSSLSKSLPNSPSINRRHAPDTGGFNRSRSSSSDEDVSASQSRSAFLDDEASGVLSPRSASDSTSLFGAADSFSSSPAVDSLRAAYPPTLRDGDKLVFDASPAAVRAHLLGAMVFQAAGGDGSDAKERSMGRVSRSGSAAVAVASVEECDVWRTVEEALGDGKVDDSNGKVGHGKGELDIKCQIPEDATTFIGLDSVDVKTWGSSRIRAGDFPAEGNLFSYRTRGYSSDGADSIGSGVFSRHSDCDSIGSGVFEMDIAASRSSYYTMTPANQLATSLKQSHGGYSAYAGSASSEYRKTYGSENYSTASAMGVSTGLSLQQPPSDKSSSSWRILLADSPSLHEKEPSRSFHETSEGTVTYISHSRKMFSASMSSSGHGVGSHARSSSSKSSSPAPPLAGEAAVLSASVVAYQTAAAVTEATVSPRLPSPFPPVPALEETVPVAVAAATVLASLAGQTPSNC